VKEIIPVVAACIVDEQRGILLHRKNEPRNPELLGKWEFPGGMMEYGEDPYASLRREIRLLEKF
jgi:8-oxo-dGTP pyrophosphatase MutT (NUDIX family)